MFRRLGLCVCVSVSARGFPFSSPLPLFLSPCVCRWVGSPNISLRQYSGKDNIRMGVRWSLSLTQNVLVALSVAVICCFVSFLRQRKAAHGEKKKKERKKIPATRSLCFLYLLMDDNN